MPQYLVTGGAGFIGSHLVAALLGRGAKVGVLDNFSTGKRQNLESPVISTGAGQLRVVEGDIRDPRAVQEAVRGADVVFHEAAFISVPESMEQPAVCLDVNFMGTCALLEACRQSGVRRVVLASSAAVYGDSDALPLSEQERARPLSPYAASKLATETFATLYTQSFGLEVSALRYFNVYGPRQRPDTQYAAAIPIFIERLRSRMAPTVFGDGTQTRDLIFVGDVVRANLLAAEHPDAAGTVFNVCTGAATSILDLLDALYSLLPAAPKPAFEAKRAGDIWASIGNPSKAEAVLGFRAETSLVEGLKETLQ
ncbi:MAG: NAD-dependent epimerase/dehydratase family protein [Anaerolineales bacterium]